MVKTTLRASWYEEPGSHAGSGPRKCPECGAALRDRGGRDYCWFCEKEIDLAGGNMAFHPDPSADGPGETEAPRKEVPSRLDDLTDEGPPVIKGTIVFEDEEGGEDATTGDEGEGDGFEIDDDPADLEGSQGDDEAPAPAAAEATEADPDVGAWPDEEWGGHDAEDDEGEEGFEVDEGDIIGEEPVGVLTEEEEMDAGGGSSDPAADEEWGTEEVVPEPLEDGPAEDETPSRDGAEEEISFDEDEDFVIDDEAADDAAVPKKRTVPGG